MGGVGLGKHWSALILILIRSNGEGFVNPCPSGFFVEPYNFVNAASFRQIWANAGVALWWEEDCPTMWHLLYVPPHHFCHLCCWCTDVCASMMCLVSVGSVGDNPILCRFRLHRGKKDHGASLQQKSRRILFAILFAKGPKICAKDHLWFIVYKLFPWRG